MSRGDREKDRGAGRMLVTRTPPLRERGRLKQPCHEAEGQTAGMPGMSIELYEAEHTAKCPGMQGWADGVPQIRIIKVQRSMRIECGE